MFPVSEGRETNGHRQLWWTNEESLKGVTAPWVLGVNQWRRDVRRGGNRRSLIFSQQNRGGTMIDLSKNLYLDATRKDAVRRNIRSNEKKGGFHQRHTVAMIRATG